jgi:hypothetical protein
MSSPVYSTPEWYMSVKDQDVSSDIGRLTILHHGFKQADSGTLVFAPVDFTNQARAALDIGTADGLWMRDLQSSIPPPPTGSHTFLGTDINATYFPATAPKHHISKTRRQRPHSPSLADHLRPHQPPHGPHRRRFQRIPARRRSLTHQRPQARRLDPDRRLRPRVS